MITLLFVLIAENDSYFSAVTRCHESVSFACLIECELVGDQFVGMDVPANEPVN